MLQDTPSSSAVQGVRVWPPQVAPAGMRCRRCGYDVSTLAVRRPEGTVQCPECAILSLVPQVPAEAPMEARAADRREFQSGRPLAIVAMLFGLLGLLIPLMSLVSMAMAAVAMEVSRGRRGLLALLLGASVAVFRVVLPALGFFEG